MLPSSSAAAGAAQRHATTKFCPGEPNVAQIQQRLHIRIAIKCMLRAGCLQDEPWACPEFGDYAGIHAEGSGEQEEREELLQVSPAACAAGLPPATSPVGCTELLRIKNGGSSAPH